MINSTLTALIVTFISVALHAAPRPNVILMMADDMGWGDTGYNGHKELKTPHLDQMATEGIRFDRFYSANAMCSPTRGSCYTGRHPYRYGITFAMKGMLEPNEIVITTVLKKAGYTTGHFGKWHMGTLNKTVGDQKRWGTFAKRPGRYYCPPWDRDVDVSFVTESKVPTWNPMVTPAPIKKNGNAEETGKPYGNDYFVGLNQKATKNLAGDDSRVLMDRVIPFVRGAVKKEQPFFAAVWFHAPHSPVVAGPRHRAMYKGLSENKQHYYGCVTALDEQVGRLRAELKTLGIADNTMIWFCSDNGPARQGPPREVGSSGPLSGHKLSLREGGIRVPGLLCWPQRYPTPKIIKTPCFTSDYFPTILAALDLPMPTGRPYDGVNILPFVDDPESTRAAPLGFLHGEKHAWIENQYKLYSGNGKKFALYDLDNDVGEKHDLASSKPELHAKMVARFKQWQHGVLKDLNKVPK